MKKAHMLGLICLLMTVFCVPAYAQIDVILTDSYPICIYDGEVPICGFVPVDFEKGVYVPEAAAEHEQNQKRYDEWLRLCDNTYHEFCQLYIHPESRDMNQFGDDMSAEELIEYVRQNGQSLIDEGLLEPGLREVPRRSLGEIKDVEYETISRQYLIPLKDGKTAVLDTPEGYTFLGGTFEPKPYYDRAEKLALMSAQSGWKALNFPNAPVCTVQRFCGNDEAGYYHINELYSWGDLVDKQKKVENLLILPIEECRGMMATATQNWALEQAIEQSQTEGFDKQWQEWTDWNEQYGN